MQVSTKLIESLSSVNTPLYDQVHLAVILTLDFSSSSNTSMYESSVSDSSAMGIYKQLT